VRRTTHGVRFDQQRPGATVGAGTGPGPARRRLYVSVTVKFLVAQALAAGWLGVSVWLSLPWLRELAAAITIVPAVLVVCLVAYLPGWLVAFLAVSLLLDRQPPLRRTHPAVPVTVLVAARNEADRIQETLSYIAGQDYPVPIEVLVVDNGSTDGTRAVAEAYGAATGQRDYFLGIASVKRMQGLYQGTLVAQGAFSLYRAQAVLEAGGWPDAIGEDIVLTWQLMRRGARVYYEPSAVAFTAAPARLVHLARQRARWARGMVEGLRSLKPWNQPRWLLRFLTAIDLLIPALDVAYALVWLPGLVLAATGRYWIVGPYTLAVLPLTLVVNAILYRFQRRRVFNLLGLRVRRNALGFLGFVLTYQMLLSPIAVVGYGQELMGLRRRWK
jgi:cellulose synthase/poly-beta-1,6-N-acetylglucosamine synthase-like glycosyltransferase